jgi:octaprenyl-diphosphate synthase
MNINKVSIAEAQSKTIDISSSLALVDAEMQAVNEEINRQMTSDVALINQLGTYIINAGGKRLRPVTVLLAACAGQKVSVAKNPTVISLAAIIEFIHTATLLHDDVVDESARRRGQETANELFGNAASVLVGDFLYSRSFQMMVSINSMRVMEILSHTTNTIAEGEVMQLMNIGVADTTEQAYFETIRRKTAILFEAAALLATVATNQSSAIEQAMRNYGLHLGIAFQLVDDVLDYTADANEMGKNVGDDLAEGKPTLPLIHALARAESNDRDTIIAAIENADRSTFDNVLKIIESTGALAYTARQAREHAQLAQDALAIVPDSAWKNAMLDIAAFSVERTY